MQLIWRNGWQLRAAYDGTDMALGKVGEPMTTRDLGSCEMACETPAGVSQPRTRADGSAQATTGRVWPGSEPEPRVSSPGLRLTLRVAST
eukprot:258452-Rhodomonas_salina.1